MNLELDDEKKKICKLIKPETINFIVKSHTKLEIVEYSMHYRYDVTFVFILLFFVVIVARC